MSALSAVGALASVFSGPMLQTMYLNNQTDKLASRVRDFSKCPKCGSQDTREVRRGELEKKDTTRSVAVLHEEKDNHQRYAINPSADTEALLTRALMFLEDGEWETAKRYCSFILDAEPMNPKAYLAMFLAERQVDSIEKLKDTAIAFDENKNYCRFLQFAPSEMREAVEKYNEDIKNEIAEKARRFLEMMNRTDEELAELQAKAAMEDKGVFICGKCGCDLVEMGYAISDIEAMYVCPVCGEPLTWEKIAKGTEKE